MFGLLQKMDNFSNGQMTEEQKIDFMQEVIDTGLVWDMHKKYISQAAEYLNVGKCVDMVLFRKQDANLNERYQAASLAGVA